MAPDFRFISKLLSTPESNINYSLNISNPNDISADFKTNVYSTVYFSLLKYEMKQSHNQLW